MCTCLWSFSNEHRLFLYAAGKGGSKSYYFLTIDWNQTRELRKPAQEVGEFSPCTGSVDDDACFALLGRQAGRQAGSRYSGGVELSSDWLVGALWKARKCPAQREVQSHRPSLFGRRLLLLELWAGPRSRPKPRDQGEESPQGLRWAVPLLWVAHSQPPPRGGFSFSSRPAAHGKVLLQFGLCGLEEKLEECS